MLILKSVNDSFLPETTSGVTTMKQIKVSVGKKGAHNQREHLDGVDTKLKSTLERLKKKGLNPMQMCNKLIEHEVAAPKENVWSYDLVVSECKRLKI